MRVGPPGQTQNLKTYDIFHQNKQFRKFSASVRKTLGGNQLCFVLNVFCLPSPLGPVAGDSPHCFRPNRFADDGEGWPVEPLESQAVASQDLRSILRLVQALVEHPPGGLPGKLKTSKTHNFDDQNQTFWMFSASVRKTLGGIIFMPTTKRFLPTIHGAAPCRAHLTTIGIGSIDHDEIRGIRRAWAPRAARLVSHSSNYIGLKKQVLGQTQNLQNS